MDLTQQKIEGAKLPYNDNGFRLPLEESIDEANMNINTYIAQNASFLQQYAKFLEASSSKSILTHKDFDPQHIDKLTFQCPVCSVRIGTKEELKNHIINAHNSTSKYVDEILMDLDTDISSTCKYGEEQKQDTPDDAVSTCKTTSQAHFHAFMNSPETCISNAHSINEVVSSREDPKHINKLPFQCPVCSVGIGTKEELKIHIINAHNSTSEYVDKILKAVGTEVSSTSNLREEKRQDTPDDAISTCKITSQAHCRAFLNSPETFISNDHSINEVISSREPFQNTNTVPTVQLSDSSLGIDLTKYSNKELRRSLKTNDNTKNQNRFNKRINNKVISSSHNHPVYLYIMNRACTKCGKIFTSVSLRLEHEIKDHAGYSEETPASPSSSPKAAVHEDTPSINIPGQSNVMGMDLSMLSPLPININMMTFPLNMYHPYITNLIMNAPYWYYQNLSCWPNPNMNNYPPPIPTNRPARKRRLKSVNNKNPSQHSSSVTNPNLHAVMAQNFSQSNKRAKKIPEGWNQNTSAHANKENISDEYLKQTIDKKSDLERRNLNQHSGANFNTLLNRSNSTGSEESVSQWTYSHSLCKESTPSNLHMFDTENVEATYRKTIIKDTHKEVNKTFKNTLPLSISQTFAASCNQSSRNSDTRPGGCTRSPNAQIYSRLPVTDSAWTLYDSSKTKNNSQFESFDNQSTQAVNFTECAKHSSDDQQSGLNKQNVLNKNFLQRLFKKDYQKGQNNFEEREYNIYNKDSINTLREEIFMCKSCPATFREYTQLIRHRQFSCLETYNCFEAISDDEEPPAAQNFYEPQPSGIVIPKITGIDAFYNNRNELRKCVQT